MGQKTEHVDLVPICKYKEKVNLKFWIRHKNNEHNEIMKEQKKNVYYETMKEQNKKDIFPTECILEMQFDTLIKRVIKENYKLKCINQKF